MRVAPFLIVAALGSLSLPADGSTQTRRLPGASTAWPAPQGGVRFGYDDSSNANVVGAQIRVPLLRSGRLELMPMADITFLTGLREYQAGVEAVVLSGSGRGGLYGGGGLVWRNSIYDTEQRETRRGTSLVVGLLSRGRGAVPIGTQLEIRWIFLDADFRPRALTFGVNLPLWGWAALDPGSR